MVCGVEEGIGTHIDSPAAFSYNDKKRGALRQAVGLGFMIISLRFIPQQSSLGRVAIVAFLRQSQCVGM